MRTNGKAAAFGLVAMTLVLIAGLAWMLHLRMQSGDVYPRYSSLRLDSSGTSILFEGFERLPGIEAIRNYRPLEGSSPHDAAIFLLGIQPYKLLQDGESLRLVEDLGKKRNRVILALDAGRGSVHARRDGEKSELAKRWGVELANAPEGTERWPVYFAGAKGWKTWRSDEGRAVIIERQFGTGSVTLMANGSPLTNRAMRDDRDPILLAWLPGTKVSIVFDESHFGITETGSVLGLARRYRMQGLLIGLVLVALLFVWKSAGSFPPVANQDVAELRALEGRDSMSGFTHLLRRNIAPADVIRLCVKEWGKQLLAAESIARECKDPVEAYRRIQRTAEQRRSRS